MMDGQDRTVNYLTCEKKFTNKRKYGLYQSKTSQNIQVAL